MESDDGSDSSLGFDDEDDEDNNPQQQQQQQSDKNITAFPIEVQNPVQAQPQQQSIPVRETPDKVDVKTHQMILENDSGNESSISRLFGSEEEGSDMEDSEVSGLGNKEQKQFK